MVSKKNADETSSKLEVASTGSVASVVQKITTRRDFLKVAGLGALGVYFMGCSSPEEEVSVDPVKRQVYAANAAGMIIGNPARCVGCRRCELACTEFNEGISQPSIARVNVRRNWGFGPGGVQLGYWRGEGRFGNHRVIPDTCRQCPHPIPCQLACPYDAIEVLTPVNARVINQEKCQGCRTCQRACPWGMTTFNEVSGKATKCHLCQGEPECVNACPSGALQYIPWEDRTKDVPQRFVVPSYIKLPDGVDGTCVQCH